MKTEALARLVVTPTSAQLKQAYDLGYTAAKRNKSRYAVESQELMALLKQFPVPDGNTAIKEMMRRYEKGYQALCDEEADHAFKN